MTKKKPASKSSKQEKRRIDARKRDEEERERRANGEENKKKKFLYDLLKPAPLHAVLLAATIFTLYMASLYDVLDGRRLLFFYLPVGALLFFGMWRWRLLPRFRPRRPVPGAGRSSKTLSRLRRLYLDRVSYFILATTLYTACLWSLFILGNCALDGAPARAVEATVVDKFVETEIATKQGSVQRYYLRYTFDDGENIGVEGILKCLQSQYKEARTGKSRVDLRIKPGLFGYEWIASSKLLP